MDVKREGVVERKRRKRIIYGSVGFIAVIGLTAWLWSLEPAAPPVPRSSVYIGKVERGEMLRQVRGPGTLVPEEIRWIAARTAGRVERRVVLPGAQVNPDTVVIILSNPELMQQTSDAFLAYRAEQAEAADLEAVLESELINDQAAAAALDSEYRQAVLQAEADDRLLEDGLIPPLDAQLSKLRADTLGERNELEKERLLKKARSVEARMRSGQARLEQAEQLYKLRQAQLDGLEVRAGILGVLQEIPVEVGQQVQPGANLARVVQPEELKAELRIPETQAKDIALGQPALVDTRNGIIDGRVMRIDPAVRNGSVTVDVELLSDLPRGARPDLSVDGTIELERLDDVLYVGRPTYGQAGSRIGLFRLVPGSDEALRVQVQLGRSSVTLVEVVDGLQVGDEVILSDTSQWDEFDRIRLN